MKNQYTVTVHIVATTNFIYIFGHHSIMMKLL